MDIVNYKWILGYSVMVIIGVILKYGITANPYSTFKEYIKKEIFRLSIVVVITGSLSKNGRLSSKHAICFFVMFYGYIIYSLLKKTEKDGCIHSGLSFVNGYFVTFLTFVSFPYSIIIGTVTVLFSWFVYKYFERQNKSEYVEILFLVFESLLFSILIWVFRINSLVWVIWVETFIASINIIVKIIIVYICKEDVDEFIRKIKGYDDY